MSVPTTTQAWSDIVEKYELEKLKDCFKCHGVDLDEVFASVGLPPVEGNGIESMEVEDTLEVEPDDFPESDPEVSTFDLTYYNEPSGCTNTLETC